MSIGSTALAAVVAAFPENVVSLCYGGDVAALIGTISSAFSAGIERVRVQTAEGMINSVSGNVRYATSDEPSGWATETNGAPAILGQVVEIKFYGETEWNKARVASRLPLQGAVRMNLVAEYEEI